MNFYQMDVEEIERYMRNNGLSVSDPMQSVIDQLKEANASLNALCESLTNNGIDAYPESVEEALKEKEVNYENLLYEYNELKKEFEEFKHEQTL